MLSTILVPLDGTPLSEYALPYAAELAGGGGSAGSGPGCPLSHCVHQRARNARVGGAADYLGSHTERLRHQGLATEPRSRPAIR